jgi:hypothetical protein
MAIKTLIPRFFFFLLFAPFLVWCLAALSFDGPVNRALNLLVIVFFLAVLVAILLKVRPFWRMAPVLFLPIVAVTIWWLLIPASNDRDWQPYFANTATATFEGDTVTIRNIRNFHYRTQDDFDEVWETRTYDLDQIVGMDMYLNYWGPTKIAHTIASWEFADGQHLSVSIETRKEKGEPYSALKGLFRQYEIYYVVADEQDTVGLRAAHRGEDVYLYRLKHPPALARAILEEYLHEINRLSEHPEWYNAIRHNCTTTIRQHARAVGGDKGWDIRFLLNGALDQMGYERGTIDTSMPFEELRRRSDITEKAKLSYGEPNYSSLIREGLPNPR